MEVQRDQCQSTDAPQPEQQATPGPSEDGPCVTVAALPGSQPLRIVSWNINGLAAACRRSGGLAGVLAGLEGADIVCLQETKLRPSELTVDVGQAQGWHGFFCCNREDRGYAGVATICRADATVPVAAEEGFTGLLPGLLADKGRRASPGPGPGSPWAGYTWEQLEALEAEGRAVVTDHGAFVLINVYAPNVSRGAGADAEERAEERAAYKIEFFRALEVRMRALLAAGRNVLLLGDLNISPAQIDVNGDAGEGFDPARPDRLWLAGHLAPPPAPLAAAAREERRRRGSAHAAAPRPGRRRPAPQRPAGAAAGPAPAQAALSGAAAGGVFSSGPGAAPAGGRAPGHGSSLGLVDVFRAFHPSRADAFTCWPTATGARANNWGTRIDLILAAGGDRLWRGGSGSEDGGSDGSGCSSDGGGGGGGGGPCGGPPPFLMWLHWSDIWPHVQGSDHAPVFADLRVPDGLLPARCEPPRAACCTHWQFKTQSSLKGWLVKGAAAQQAQQAERAPAAGPQAPGGEDGASQTGGVAGGATSGRAAAGGQQSFADGPAPARQSSLASGSSNGQLAGGGKGARGRGGGGGGGGGALKRQRSASGSGSGGGGKGQQSLMSFLVAAPKQQAKQAAAPPHTEDQAPKGMGVPTAGPAPSALGLAGAENLPPLLQGPMAEQPPQLDGQQHEHAAQQQRREPGGSQEPAVQADFQRGGPSLPPALQALHDEQQVASAGAWRELMSRVTRRPRCKGHGEECVIHTVKKDGPTKGKQFYVCARPAGPPGVGRCNFFMWAANWDPKAGAAKPGSGGPSGQPGAAGPKRAGSGTSSAGTRNGDGGGGGGLQPLKKSKTE